MTRLLKDILAGINYQLVQGSLDQLISNVTLDSRQISAGSLFVAIDGTSVDGHQFIEQVVASGASTIVVSKPVKISAEITVIETKNNRESAALIASNFYDHPSRKLQLVGITGTNGKTSIAFLLHQLFINLGYRTGLISTINVQIGTHEKLSSLTTPDAISFHSLLAEMAQAGCSFVFMEVSSHALHQSRVAGAKFRLGIFSNITHDHLDYHGSFAEYIKVKKSFFDGLDKDATALVNLDDRNGKIMLQNTSAEQKTYALQNAADYKGKVIANDRTGLQLLVDDTEIFTRLIGIFNAQNLLAVYGAAVILGQEKFEILKSISELQAPPGRFEVFQDIDNRVTALVDYAHTPDALKKALEAILDIKKPQDQVITVVGCGGNRDTSKRPKMAAIACRYSNQVVLTSDNPRDEEPAAIIRDMQIGVPEDKRDQVLSIPNRAEAIRTACLLGRGQAIILIAGKGHETYQEVRGVRIPFDDREIVKECLN